jgi:hypothetical protein
MISALERSQSFNDTGFVLIETRAVGRYQALFAREEIKHPRVVKHIIRPLTKHGTSIDGGTLLESSRLAKRFNAENVAWVVVGDIEGEFSLVASTLANLLEAKIALVPEGSGVFRGTVGGYPWVYRSWRQAAGLIAHDTLREIGDLLRSKIFRPSPRKWKRRLRLLWRLDRIVNLIFFRPGEPRSSRLRALDLVISWWPSETLAFLNFGRYELITPPWSECQVSSKKGHANSALFVHQPPPLEPSEWQEVLSAIASLPLTSITVRPDRSEIGLTDFLLGVQMTFPATTLQVATQALSSECLATREKYEYVIGFTSTVLVNLALDPSYKGKILCLIRPLVRVNDPSERHNLPIEEMAWNLAPLAPLNSSKIVFAE